MLTFPGTVRIFICRSPVDMRKSYTGLSGCVQQVLKLDPLSGHLFVFFNRRRSQVKILLWDRTGYCIYGKKLEQGKFSYQEMDTNKALSMPELLLILEGIDLGGAVYRKRYSLPEQANAVHA